jgi:hypothetical protein
VRVIPQVPAQASLQGTNHVDLCLRPDRPCLCPSGRLICNGQGPAEVSHCLSSVMTHQVHGQDPGEIQRRIHVRLDWDPAPQWNTSRMGYPMGRRYIYCSVARSLPIVAGLIWRRSCRVSSSMHKCPWFMRLSTKAAMPSARRTGPRKVLALQMVISACCTAGPYRGVCTDGYVCQGQPREYSLPGDTFVLPGAGPGPHISDSTPWTHRSRPASVTSCSLLLSNTLVPSPS